MWTRNDVFVNFASHPHLPGVDSQISNQYLTTHTHIYVNTQRCYYVFYVYINYIYCERFFLYRSFSLAQLLTISTQLWTWSKPLRGSVCMYLFAFMRLEKNCCPRQRGAISLHASIYVDSRNEMSMIFPQTEATTKKNFSITFAFAIWVSGLLGEYFASTKSGTFPKIIGEWITTLPVAYTHTLIVHSMCKDIHKHIKRLSCKVISMPTVSGRIQCCSERIAWKSTFYRFCIHWHKPE